MKLKTYWDILSNQTKGDIFFYVWMIINAWIWIPIPYFINNFWVKWWTFPYFITAICWVFGMGQILHRRIIDK